VQIALIFRQFRRGIRMGRVTAARRTPESQVAREVLAEVLAPPAVTQSDIARRAYDLFLARDGEHGHDVDDWLQAERKLIPSQRGNTTSD
jgi:hypothetical protein